MHQSGFGCSNLSKPSGASHPRSGSFTEFFKCSGYSRFPQEHRTSPGKLHCSVIKAELGPHSYQDPAVPELVLSTPVEIIADGEASWNFGQGWARGTWAPHSLFALPPNAESRWEVDGARRVLLMVVPSATLKRILGPSVPIDPREAFSPLSRSIWSDSLIHTMLIKLWDVSERRSNVDCLTADGLLTAIIGLMLQRAGTARIAEKSFIAPFRLRKVEAFVDENIERHMNVKDLADICGLSLRHFARAFAQETGVSPHRWIMQRRLDKAKRILLDTDHDCSMIAEMCGFSSQSHLTVTLKVQSGMTPSRYRREYRRDPQ